MTIELAALGVAGRVQAGAHNEVGWWVSDGRSVDIRDGQRKRIDDDGPRKVHQRLLGRVERQRLLAGHAHYHKRLQAVLVEEDGHVGLGILLLLLISVGPAEEEKEEATISSVDATQRSGSGRASALLLLL